MDKFLKKIADVVLAKTPEELLYTAIILPNKRSEVFLKDHLKKNSTKNIWLPEMYTIDEFMVRASGMHNLDPVQIYFELFEIHKRLAGDDAREIEDFLSWAPIILSDFNDIDLSLADAKTIFAHLSDIRAMQEWNVEGDPLTDLQTNYLKFYNSLIDYYELLRKNLQFNNAGYKGMIYRTLAEQIQHLSQEWPWKNFLFVGFNALTPAEQKVIDYLNSHFNTEIFWDLDEYFLTDLGKMEAGSFVQQVVDKWDNGKPKWIENQLLTGRKDISIVGVSKRIGQVKYTGLELENRNKAGSNLLEDTAVVLADEKLLVPMLSSLPELKDANGNDIGYNITMGYPVSNGAFNQLLATWLDLLIARNEHSNRLYSVRNFIALLDNPVIKLITGQQDTTHAERLKKILLNANASFYSGKEINALLNAGEREEKYNVADVLLSNISGPTEFIDKLIQLLGIVKDVLDSNDKGNFILREELVLLLTLTKKMQRLVEVNKKSINLKALQKIYIQLIRRSEINLKGEPLSGIQVMGMLETRNLDFKNIMLLSANEGILPKVENLESFIPFDIRSHFKLPLPKEKTDIYAYHFYRLLMRAEKITIIYNSNAGEFGGGEPSRFILQLKNELADLNRNLSITEKLLDFPAPVIAADNKIEIAKDSEVMKLLEEKVKIGLSPSSLSNFINCPLQFYLSNILGFRSPVELEQSIESDVFGTVVHGVLERLYKPFKGKEIDTTILKESLNSLDKIINEQFAKHYPGGDLNSGQNLLTVKVVHKYVTRFIEKDIHDLKKVSRIFLEAEQMLFADLSVDGLQIKLKGQVDRIDSAVSTGRVRLIDYKTGSVEARDLDLKSWDELITDPKYSKVFQLLFYLFIYSGSTSKASDAEAGIISLRKLSGGFLLPKLPDNDSWSVGISIFESLLESLITDLLNSEKPFVQTENEDNCTWCDFKSICNRSGSKLFS